jgi:hypothetical protein
MLIITPFLNYLLTFRSLLCIVAFKPMLTIPQHEALLAYGTALVASTQSRSPHLYADLSITVRRLSGHSYTLSCISAPTPSICDSRQTIPAHSGLFRRSRPRKSTQLQPNPTFHQQSKSNLIRPNQTLDFFSRPDLPPPVPPPREYAKRFGLACPPHCAKHCGLGLVPGIPAIPQSP